MKGKQIAMQFTGETYVHARPMTTQILRGSMSKKMD
jgi:hypothetical protein